MDMTALQQTLQQEVATLSDESALKEILRFIRFLKWEYEDYVDDERLSEEERRDGLSYEWRQALREEQLHAKSTGELYSWQQTFGTSDV
jgi:hypothetical protein